MSPCVEGDPRSGSWMTSKHLSDRPKEVGWRTLWQMVGRYPKSETYIKTGQRCDMVCSGNLSCKEGKWVQILLLCTRPYARASVLTTFWSWCDHCSHFIGEETKAKRQVIGQVFLFFDMGSFKHFLIFSIVEYIMYSFICIKLKHGI